MTFDGVDRFDSPFIPKGAYHPGSQATGIVLEKSLAAAYAYARTHGRVCWRWDAPMNFGYLLDQLTWSVAAANAHVTVGAGYHVLPPQVNVLYGWFAFAHFNPANANASLILHVTDGTHTDQSAPIRVPLGAQQQASKGAGPPVQSECPIADPNTTSDVPLFTAALRLRLVHVPAGVLVISRIKAFVSAEVVTGTTTGVTFQPHSSMVIWGVE